MTINYDMLPQHMRDVSRRYIENGIPGGSFFTAVVSNDLMGAYGRADSDNKDAMGDWCAFFYNEAPVHCHGSPAIVSAWVKRGGINGRKSA